MIRAALSALKRFGRPAACPIASPETAFFEENGYVIFQGAVDAGLCAQARAQLAETIERHGPALVCQRFSKIGAFPEFGLKSIFDEFNIIRITNVEQYSAFFRTLALSDVVKRFLGDYYGGAQPTLLQTLTYAYSSQQGAHSDLRLVSPGWAGNYDRGTLAAAWFALEDADTTNGALVIYPGSHKIEKKQLAEFDGYGTYVDYLKDLMAQHGIEEKVFTAKQGDVLFWHGDFVHAGGVATDQSKTRLSLVCHYAKIDDSAQPVSRYRPLPGNARKLYRAENGKLFL
jgi:ectoine hydroxylase-related dioxygenase (phytanoyl-CoA dioxygenase family)